MTVNARNARAAPPATDVAAAGETVASWLARSPRVLIGAGAGLSVAAGIDYTDMDDFARRFPALVRRGLRARYQLIGYQGLSDAEFWGYWAAHVQDVRFTERRSAVYAQLFELVRAKDYFVLTSNVDAMFVRHGFEPARVCSIQGDYANLQCVRPCSPAVWPTQPVIERLLPGIDPASQAVTDLKLIPRCPRCGGGVFMNVRAGSWFVDAPYRSSLADLRAWLGKAEDQPLLVLDIGSGFNTPTVVRWPMERVAAHHPNARLVRINLEHPEVPPEIGERGLAIAAGAAETIGAVSEAINGNSPKESHGHVCE